ncbi:hypothetical protein SH661x_004322 [Planctomicrobium sp. SH661]|uniref:hypothetical protein n=1 Tax=Planctomicrobium sp. SH661 TaxID=3448124 RepID=UPI003F5C8D93
MDTGVIAVDFGVAGWMFFKKFGRQKVHVRDWGPAGSGSPSAGGQLTDNACGMACGQHVLGDAGIDVFQSNLATGFFGGLTPQDLAANINKFQPGWVGGFVNRLSKSSILKLYSSSGKFIARFGGVKGHFVVVTEVTADVVKYWDPKGGVCAQMAIDEFLDIMTGIVHKGN